MRLPARPVGCSQHRAHKAGYGLGLAARFAGHHWERAQGISAARDMRPAGHRDRAYLTRGPDESTSDLHERGEMRSFPTWMRFQRTPAVRSEGARYHALDKSACTTCHDPFAFTLRSLLVEACPFDLELIWSVEGDRWFGAVRK